MFGLLKRVTRVQSGGYLAAALGISLTVLALLPFRANFRGTPGLVFVLLIVLVATGWGSKPALFASFLSLCALSYFFIPPYKTLHVAQPHYLFTVIAFAVSALTVGQLSAHARRRAEEAEQARSELQSAFEQASQAEALRRSEQFKSALLDCISHDLRTPLNSIKLAIATLERDQDLQTTMAANQRELLGVAGRETERLKKLISNLVDMGRIEAGEFKLRRSAADVNEIVSKALEHAQAVCMPSRVRICVPECLPPVHADVRAVAQVIYTLVENACKYAPPATAISISANHGRNGEVCFFVEDKGPGIPPQLRERVFEKFYRIEEAIAAGEWKPGTAGSGMGLAIARGIVEAHNGRIWIEDGEGGTGTRVLLTLPICAVDDYARDLAPLTCTD